MLVEVQEAQARLCNLLERVAAGEEIVIGKAGRPVARLVPYVEEPTPRRPGRWAGQVEMEEGFDGLPEQVLDLFEGR